MKECIDEVNQDLQKLHCCLGKKRKHLEILGLQIASNKAEEQSIQAKKNLTIKETKIKRNFSVAAMFDKASGQISEIEATAQDQTSANWLSPDLACGCNTKCEKHWTALGISEYTLSIFYFDFN